MNVLGGILIVVGMMVMAGSAGDCDGKCMEYANDIGTMLKYAAIGFAITVAGGMILILKGDFNE